MLSNDRKQISLLHPVHINYDLAKWKKDEDKKFELGAADSGSMMMSGGTVSNHFGGDQSDIWDGVPFTVRRSFTNQQQGARLLADIYIRVRLLFTKPGKKFSDFFMDVKDNFSELKNIKIDDDKMKAMIENLEHMRQKYAIGSLHVEKNLQKLENKLVEAGIVQYQDEKQLIKWIRKTEKGLRFTEIEYFDRVIPEDAMAKFDKAEATKIFDNYYILYFDPTGAKNIHYTKEEDPIMFGVIRGSTKLYFIADWIDEFCNLTYKDILKSDKCYKAVDSKLKTVDIKE